MSHSYTNLLYHIVFTTKERHPWLDAAVGPRVFAYLGGLVRKEDGIALLVNGMPDHVHLLAKLRQDKAVSDVVRAIKANSSGWVHRTYPGCAGFAWQTGYGAFSVSQSQVGKVRTYIANQEEHHRQRTVQQEFRALLRAHGIPYKEEDLWD
jgi:REP element-mobilizing transposase RayT